jgi:CBS domain-containing protein
MIENVVTIKGDTTAESAIKTLNDKHIGSVIVVDKKRRCKGIFTGRDALRMIVQKTSLSTPISDVMTKNPITIRDNASFSEAISIVSHHGIRHLPVVDENEQLVGILSIRRLLDEVIGR